MKKRIITATIVLILATVFTGTALAGAAGSAKYVNTVRLAPNLTYTNTVLWHNDYGREETYILRNQPGGDVYPIAMKDETIYGGVDINTAVRYAESTGKTVLAAINADFFSMQTGVPLGIVIEDGIYKSSPSGLPAVGFRADGTLVFAEAPKITITLTNNGTEEESANVGKTASITNLNKMRHEYGGLYLFSEHFSTVSTRATGKGWYVHFEILEGEMTLGGQMKLRVTNMTETEGAVPIDKNTLILSASGAVGEVYASFAIGDEVTLEAQCDNEYITQSKWASGGGDIIVRNGEVTDTANWSAEISGRSPKTAIGVTATGEIVAYVVDGRNSTYGNGLNLKEVAEEMVAQGCVAAMNLDGGGSTAMSVRRSTNDSAQIVNRPSDGVPRKSSTYIFFVTDNVPDRVMRHLSLKNDGTIVLPGSSFTLVEAATDSSYRNVNTIGQPKAVSRGLGSVEYVPLKGNVYTAGQTDGVDIIDLESEDGTAFGTGEVRVLTHPTSVTAYDENGRQLTNEKLTPGATIKLAPVATYYRKNVVAQPHSFKYEVIGDIGTITPDGVFTAATGNHDGEIRITAGTQTALIKVTITGFTDTVTHWAREFINHLTSAGIVNGTSETTFSPEDGLRRGDFILMLHRAAGSPKPTQETSFVDVDPASYYGLAIAWAKENGIATGSGDGNFDPAAALTREQAFVFLYRALAMMNVTVPTELVSMDGFADADAVESSAREPINVLITLGVVQGDDGKINPQGPLTRAQMAKILSATLNLAVPSSAN